MLLWLLLLNELSFSVCHDYVYHFIDEHMSWCDAKRYCRKKYTDLATFNNMADQKRLEEAVQSRISEGAWIGLHNKSREREWHWPQPDVKFEEPIQWGDGEPNDEDGIENCVLMDPDLKLFTGGCEAEICFICNNGSTSVPFEHKKTWIAAQHHCRKHFTDLISGQEQLELMKSLLTQETCKRNWWIGLFRDTWGWSDGSDSFFRNWNQSEQHMGKPYTKHDGKNCAKLVGPEGRWNRDNCSKPLPFICYDKRFILVRQNKTWEEAMGYCRQHYRDLAWHIGPHQLRMVQERAKMADTDVVWVGLHFTCFFEEWIWVNGHYVSKEDENWKQRGLGKCGESGAMEKEGENKWVKKKSEERYNFICAM